MKSKLNTTNNPFDNEDRVFKCAGLGCQEHGKYYLKIIYIQKHGWFCDSCAKTLATLKLIEEDV